MPKFRIGDILQHNMDEYLKRKIISIFYEYEIVYYQTVILEFDIPPTPMEEYALDKYYTLMSSCKSSCQPYP